MNQSKSFLFSKQEFEKLSKKDKRSDSLYQKFSSAEFPSTKQEEYRFSKIPQIDFNGLSQLTEESIPILSSDSKLNYLKESQVPSTNSNDWLDLVIDAFYQQNNTFNIVENSVQNIAIKNHAKHSNVSKLKFVLKPNSTLNLVEYVSNHSASKVFVGRKTEFVLEDFSKLNYCLIQTLNENSVFYHHLDFGFSGQSSQSNFVQCHFSDSVSKVNVNSYLQSINSQFPINQAAFLLENSGHFDLTTNVFHSSQKTKSDIIVKGGLKNGSSSFYKGMIKIDKGAKGTDSFLQDRVIHLDKNVTSNSIPSLKIDENDVRASHGATVSKLNDESLFYISSRGIDKTNAQRIVMEGFLHEVIDSISDFEAKDFATRILKEKLEKKFQS